jgi:RND family efflux transporter MFP subunit
MWKWIVKISILLVVGVLIAGVVLHRSKASAGRAQTALQTVTLTRNPFTLTISANGVVEPRYTIEIRSKASGEIKEVGFEVGDGVKKGQVLLRLDPTLERRRVNQSKAELSIAWANYRKAAANYLHSKTRHQRTQKLLKRGLVSREDAEKLSHEVATRRAERSIAYAQITRAKESLKEAKDRLKDTQIVAPGDGVVLQRFVQPGQIIFSGTNSASGGTLLLKMADLAQLFVRGHVDEADVARVRAGMKATITADALWGRSFQGTILRVDPEGKNSNNVVVFEVIVRLPPAAVKVMKINMTTNLKIQVEQRQNVLTVPSLALRKRGSRSGVYVLRGGKPRFQPVKTGVSNGMKAIVLAGLRAGDRVVLSQLEQKKSNRGRRKRSSSRTMGRMMR